VRSAEIRERFLRFFEDRGHHRLPSSSLIPHDDPSLLFTVAGMVPLKPYISGQRKPPSPRLVSCQKCFRGAGLKYDDIASVGDSFHHTFFEMLGNWSIGDYFKDKAIEYAWELVTGDFGLDPARVWVSVYPDDAAAEESWAGKIGVPRERIAKLTDNWWAAGVTGPCGYDSEMYWDWGPPCSCGRLECTPQDECAGDRWCEFWNLVFMEFDQQPDGSRPLLPKPTVDTGMGMERITAILQGKRSDYETDLFAPLVADFRSRASTNLDSADGRRSLNVLADHLRAAGFLISAGVTPSNEGPGYVLRRVIRRAAVHGRRVGLTGGLAAGVGELVALMGPIYPELVEHHHLVEQQLRDEEAGFARTLEAGAERLEALLASGVARIGGDDAFRLYDTFGLPVELTVEMAAERGVAVDLHGFHSAMEEQRLRSRGADVKASLGFSGDLAATPWPKTLFVGYETLETEAKVVRIGVSETQEALPAGEAGTVFLDVTPFYAEAGGQIGDAGALEWAGGRATVRDTTYIPGTEARAHHVYVEIGELHREATVRAIVDPERRAQTARHHSATHLLNRALREVLGGAVVQRGSYVGPEHATFDFSFTRALSEAELADIEHRVNAAIRRNLERSVAEMTLAQARASGAVALIDEKYGEKVRVVDFGGWSRELCGGTHVSRTGDLGAAIITSESSIGQGIRRIDMVAGESAEHYWRENASALHAASRALRARPQEVAERVAGLQDRLKRLERELEQARRGAPSGGGVRSATVEEISGIAFAHLVLDGEAGGDGVVDALDRLFSERLQGDGVAVVLGETSLAIKVGGRALQAGLGAKRLIETASEKTGGRGGGKEEFAQGSIKDPAGREAAVAAIRDVVAQAAGSAS
jgi:alanyl-tRNA synthetase